MVGRDDVDAAREAGGASTGGALSGASAAAWESCRKRCCSTLAVRRMRRCAGETCDPSVRVHRRVWRRDVPDHTRLLSDSPCRSSCVVALMCFQRFLLRQGSSARRDGVLSRQAMRIPRNHPHTNPRDPSSRAVLRNLVHDPRQASAIAAYHTSRNHPTAAYGPPPTGGTLRCRRPKKRYPASACDP